ncbi:MAG: UDP-N-acetylmuramoyl-L-alanyl-D-glutamate--2,6-diaminopimelate ligase [Flavobacteriaceae bacterium]
MIALQDLLYRVSLESVSGDLQLQIASLAFDSRKVTPQTLFVALKGESVDGHDYIPSAIERGAIAILCEKLPESQAPECTYLQVSNSHEALGVMASTFYGNPSQDIKVVGVTGTNGKTSVASMLYDLFESLGYPAGLLSTVKVCYGATTKQATHTTPDPLQIQEHFSKMRAGGIAYCFMEVSSHGIAQNRIAGITFAGGVYTNLTHDHLDYHKTFAAYRDTKKEFFDQLPKQAFALINADDKNGTVMLQNCVAKKYTYALQNYADYPVQILEQQFGGMLLKIQSTEVWTTLVGRFNASNLVAVFAVADLLGLDALDSLSAISQLQSVPGRFQVYTGADNRYVIVDYAHTPDALASTLETINEIRTKNETLITIVGCGGNRDQEKRPQMGYIAAQKSNHVIFTSDNPREEDPRQILDEMRAGVAPEAYKKTLVIEDRKEAIQAAFQFSQPNDIVLIAGKGHEVYQEIKGEKIPFNDYEIAKKIFSNTD